MAHIKTLHSHVTLNIITGLSEQMPFTSRIQQKRPAEKQQVLHGAENGTQTRDPQLGRLVLYRLSYFRVISLKSDAKIMKRAIICKPIAKLQSFFTQNSFFFPLEQPRTHPFQDLPRHSPACFHSMYPPSSSTTL